MLQKTSMYAELILFWSAENGITKAMLYDDFDAVVAGIAPMSQYARSHKRGAYVQLDEALAIKGVALFNISFDKTGYPVDGWNIPLSHLVEIAALGPDLGKGPIRLACRSQCPVSWHATKMWDPLMEEGDNTFIQIQRYIPDTCSRLGIKKSKAYAEEEKQSSFTITETGIPILTTTALAEGQFFPIMTDQTSLLEQKIQDLSLQLQTLTTEKNETITLQSYVHQQQLDILQTQNMKLVEQQKALNQQLQAQQERLEALHNQIISLTGIEESLRQERDVNQKQIYELHIALSAAGQEQQHFASVLDAKEQEYQARINRLQAEHLLTLDKRLEEEVSRYLLKMKSLYAELHDYEAQIKEYEQHIEALGLAQAQQQEAGADSFLRRLESIGMSFVAFHPGVGNLSVPVNDLAAYTQDPTAYVAEKCLVSVGHYKAWLKHYENPRCMMDIGDGQCCNSRLIRTDSPSKFVAGQSDRCARHQLMDAAIMNVLKFN
ncbi:hypothetical protein [Agitococcus lubricus]|uniref:Uncharacterized protein n=1 Tax=Agitococcus lubricus TaxID=1077255 RepID=A0A2T5IZT0_9GAMM|nr:hypothetical protein [Agitococcus lubricus]PTQ89494.1 hypothetical protein C8N29_10625 [Agitococcus lubricus]